MFNKHWYTSWPTTHTPVTPQSALHAFTGLSDIHNCLWSETRHHLPEVVKELTDTSRISASSGRRFVGSFLEVQGRTSASPSTFRGPSCYAERVWCARWPNRTASAKTTCIRRTSEPRRFCKSWKSRTKTWKSGKCSQPNGKPKTLLTYPTPDSGSRQTWTRRAKYKSPKASGSSGSYGNRCSDPCKYNDGHASVHRCYRTGSGKI